MKFVLVFVLLGFVSGNEENLRVIDSIKQEQPCNEMGGMCTVAEDCPKGELAEEEGLCPMQRKRGVECCYGISLKETRCRKYGGSCVTHGCTSRLLVKVATDCPENHRCCIFIN